MPPQRKMLQHTTKCCSMLHNAAACCTMLQHIVQCCGTLHNAVAWHKKQCHCTKHKKTTMPRHIAQRCDTKKKPSRHVAQCHGTKTSTSSNAMAHCAMPWHNTMQRHQSHCRSTKQNTMAQKQPRGTKNAAAQSAMPRHIKQCCGTKITPQNAAEECTMPLQKTTKSKMPPNTMTTTPPRPPKPNRLIVFSLKKPTKQQPPQKTQQPTRPKRTPLRHCGGQRCTG